MNSLHRAPSGSNAALTLPVQSPRDYRPASEPHKPQPSNPTLMRRYETVALLPDLSETFNQHVAPAMPVFEECATAFARGTLIPTVRGEVAIEDLIPGDYIQTANGSEPVTWIGSTTYVPGHSGDRSSLNHLTRITAQRYGGMDILVGPAARMVIRHPRLNMLLGQEAVLAPVADYADGERFLEITPGGPVQMFHLMTPNHTVLTIGGVEFETYHPGKAAGQTMSAKMRSLFLSMFPNISDLDDFGQVSMTRTSRQVIEGLLDS
ncbi:MAG: Hint domain-containing protein [Pelagimonas sp.]|jgi:hypothetical protein|nr:Hint domain-containing protein [Pelagimonas sp.]